MNGVRIWLSSSDGAAREQKGSHADDVLFFARFSQQTEVRRFINASDGEHSMKALKDASREGLRGSRQADGSTGSAVRTVQSQMPVIRFALERKL